MIHVSHKSELELETDEGIYSNRKSQPLPFS